MDDSHIGWRLDMSKGLKTNAMALLTELRSLIEQARQHVAPTATSTLTMLYWNVGRRIQRDVLKDGRADYGEQIVSTLSTQLVRKYGQGFGLRSLRRMVQFAEAFPDEPIVATLSQQSSWSHFFDRCGTTRRNTRARAIA